MEKYKSIKDAVLKKISANKIEMKPKWVFVLKSIMGIVLVLILALVFLFISSFTLFVFNQNGISSTPSFGFLGLAVLLKTLPWLLLLLVIIFLVSLEALVKRYSFGYRNPLVYSVGLIVLLAVLGSVLISGFEFHERLFERARNSRLPLVGYWYREYGTPSLEHTQVGIIKDINDSELVLTSLNGEDITIKISEETNFPKGRNLRSGDRIMVIGENEDGVVEAQGLLIMGPGKMRGLSASSSQRLK